MTTQTHRIRNLALPLVMGIVILTLAGTGFAAENSEGAHHAAQLKDFGWRLLNFAILAGIIGWAIAKAQIKKALADRRTQIETSLREARETREAAEAKLRDYSSKLDRASQELAAMRAAIIQEAEQEKQRIIAHALDAAEKIALQAALSAEQETLKARMALKAYAAKLAVELAAAKLSGAIRKEDHNRYVNDYLDKAGQP